MNVNFMRMRNLFLFCAMFIILMAGCPMPEPVAEPTVPGTMAAPTLKVGNERLIATWTAPNNGGSPITGYELQYRTGDEAWTEITEGIGTNTSHTITGLTKTAEYEVQVRAVNEIGAGDWSESAAETPPATVPDAPDAPTLYAGTGRLVALWTAPEDDGGSPVTGYELQYRTGSGAWTEIAPAPGTHDHSIDGLTNDTEYEVQARAVNAVGDSGWSEIAMKTPTDSAIRTPANMAADVNLSAALNEIIASEKPAVYVTTGTHTVNDSGDIEPTYVFPPPGITPPTYEPLTGTTITVTAGTTAGTYLVYGIKTETDDILFAEYLYVTVSPDDAVAAGGDADDDGGNGELKTAVDAGISIWGETADFNYIITAAVTDMSRIFLSNTTFNGDISLWDTAAVTDMSGMFISATAFNGDISGWDVSSVMNMDSMLLSTTVFNGDISGWDVSEVTKMASMFQLAIAFNGDISGWDVSLVTNMNNMFNGASAFNQDLEAWGGRLMSTVTKTNMFVNSGVTGDLIPSWYNQ